MAQPKRYRYRAAKQGMMWVVWEFRPVTKKFTERIMYAMCGISRGKVARARRIAKLLNEAD